MLLLDSDIMIDLLRGHPPAVAWLKKLKTEELVLPGFVAMELIQGCRDKAKLRTLLNGLGKFRLLWPTAQICDEALSAFARYHLSHALGLLDALIGQLAVSMNLPLHTFNQKHYSALSNLQTIQPYQR